jgi:hypothetical protein
VFVCCWSFLNLKKIKKVLNMRELNVQEMNDVVAAGDANACQSAILGASGMGAVIGMGGGMIGAGVGALMAGGYAAANNPACH